MRPRIAAPFLVAAILAIVLAACGAKLSTAASSHPTARASVSHAVQVLKNNKNVQQDEQLAANCLAKATSSADVAICEHQAFPKGGATRFLHCAVTQVAHHLFASVAVKRHAIAVACGGIR